MFHILKVKCEQPQIIWRKYKYRIPKGALLYLALNYFFSLSFLIMSSNCFLKCSVFLILVGNKFVKVNWTYQISFNGTSFHFKIRLLCLRNVSRCRSVSSGTMVKSTLSESTLTGLHPNHEKNSSQRTTRLIMLKKSCSLFVSF